jgi:hypothetical protein
MDTHIEHTLYKLASEFTCKSHLSHRYLLPHRKIIGIKTPLHILLPPLQSPIMAPSNAINYQHAFLSSSQPAFDLRSPAELVLDRRDACNRKSTDCCPLHGQAPFHPYHSDLTSINTHGLRTLSNNTGCHTSRSTCERSHAWPEPSS